MNAILKEETRATGLTREMFLAARAAWKAAARARTTAAEQMAAYTLLRGKPLDRAFTPITNPRKLANGQQPNQGRDQAARAAAELWVSALSPWAELLADAPRTRSGRQYEPGHPLLDAIQAAARNT